jgi:hypothetical protein
MLEWTELLAKLAEPFAREDVLWRAGATSRDKKRAQALPYAEPRVYEDRLNQVCPGDWHVFFKPWGDSRIICELTIHGVIRSSTGEFDEGKKNAIAEGTVAEAQAFKRACSKFGLGRYLYEIPIQWVDYDEEKSRLADVPQPPDKFLPKKVEPAKPQTSRGRGVNSSTLNPERAKGMSDELEKLGYPKRDQLRLASSVLEKPVRDLATLSETQALKVWSYAKSVARQNAA